MPLYGFVCEECQQEFEELVMGSAQIAEVTCPQCAGSQVQRQLSLVAAFKGSGGSASLSASSGTCAPSG